jgi:hypothetical protein
MSIAPTPKKDEGFKPKLATRISYATTKATNTFFQKPAHYLLWTILTGLIVSLFLRQHIAWQLYILLAILWPVWWDTSSNKKDHDKS